MRAGLTSTGLGLSCATLICATLGGAARAAEAPYPAGQDAAEVSRWLAAQTDASPDGLVGVAEGRAFVLAPGAVAEATTVRIEAVTPAAAGLMGGRSMRVQAVVRCADRQVRMTAVTAYEGTRMVEPARELAHSSDWRAAPEGSMMQRVVARVCGQGETSRAMETAALPPATEVAAPRQAAEPRPTPAEPAAPISRAAEIKPRLRPRSAYSGVAQIGAYGSVADAEAAWHAAAARASGEGLRLRTEAVQTGGHTLQRALVEGFASRDAAEAFCASLKRAGKPCLLRR